MNFDVADLARQLSNIIRIGTVAELNHEHKKVRVSTGGIITAWLPWPASHSAHRISWQPLRLGSQVVIASPTGELSSAVIIAQLYSSAHSAPSSDAQIERHQFDDGSWIEYSRAEGSMRVHATGDVHISTDANVHITANQAIVNASATTINSAIEINGNVSLNGQLTATGDVTAAGKSLMTHTHAGVKAGGSSTSTPN